MSVETYCGTEGLEPAAANLLAGAVVAHPAFDMGLRRTTSLIRERSIGILDGPPGTGKTTTALAAAGTLAVPCYHVTMPEDPNPLSLLRLLGAQLIAPEAFDWTGDKLKYQLLPFLRERKPFIIVDEANYLRRRGLSHLQYLHDRSGRSFPLLMVGTDLEAHIQRQLATLSSRTRYRTVFEPLNEGQLVTFLSKLDSRLGDAEPMALATLDGSYAKGRLREWGHILAVMDSSGVSRPLKEKQAQALLAIISGRAAA